MGKLIPATVALVHGNFLGPWSWNDVTEVLASAQVPAKTIRLPSSTTDGSGPRGDLYADATQVRAVLDSLRGPVVLCGHSYGGAVMTQAAAGPHPAVRRLVYLTGAAPDVGESLTSLACAADTAIRQLPLRIILAGRSKRALISRVSSEAAGHRIVMQAQLRQVLPL